MLFVTYSKLLLGVLHFLTALKLQMAISITFKSLQNTTKPHNVLKIL